MNKKLLKRFLSLLIVFSLIASSLSGCFIIDAYKAVWFRDKNDTNHASVEEMDVSEKDTYHNDRETKDPNTDPYSDQGFVEFTDRIFAYFLQDSTLNMHYFIYDAPKYGLNPYHVSFPDMDASDEAIEQYTKDMESFLNELRTFDYDKLGWEEQFMYDVLEDLLITECETEDFSFFAEPLSASNGVQSSLPVELAEYTFYDERDVETYLSLLKGVLGYFEDIIQFELVKKEKGYFMEDDILTEVIDQCKEFVDGRTDDNFLYVTFEDRLNSLNLSEQKKSEYIEKNKEAVERLYVAYQYLVDSLPQFYGSNVYKGGLSNYPGGRDYYRYLVRTNIGTDKTPEELIKEVDDGIEEGFTRLREISANNPKIYEEWDHYEFPSKDPNLIMRMLMEACKEDFPETNLVDYNINYVDESLREYLAPAFYLVTPFDKSSVNNIYINSKRGEEDEDIFVTLAHEGYPGHLYQHNFLRDNSKIALRSIFSTNGFDEGYGEYVEHLSYAYPDNIPKDLSEMMRINDQVTIMIYARVDLGIHYEGWDKKAVKKYISPYFNDADGTATWMYNHILGDPGGYLDYVIGEMEILELKEVAKTAVNFTEKDFHLSLLTLSGAPFYIIKKWMFE